MSSDSLSSALADSTSKKSKRGRKGDPRMSKAISARLADPSLTLFDALRIGGFDYPSDSNPYAVDGNSVTLAQRKNQLSRRLRLARKQEQETEQAAQESMMKRPRDASEPEKPLLRQAKLSAGAREQMEKLLRHSEQALDTLAHMVSSEEEGDATEEQRNKRARFDRTSSCPERQPNHFFMPSFKAPKRKIESFPSRLGMSASGRNNLYLNPSFPGNRIPAKPKNPFMDMARDLLEAGADVVPRLSPTGQNRPIVSTKPATSIMSAAPPPVLPLAEPAECKRNPFMEMAQDILDPGFSVTPRIVHHDEKRVKKPIQQPHRCVQKFSRNTSLAPHEEDPFMEEIEQLDLEEQNSQLLEAANEDGVLSSLEFFTDSMDSIETYFEENQPFGGLDDIMLE